MHHLELVSHLVHKKGDLESNEHVLAVTAPDMQKHKQDTDRHIVAIHRELEKLSEEVDVQIAPLTEDVIKLGLSFSDLTESFSELTFTVQSLQVTGYDGEFVWMIPEVARRVREARKGKTISVYSAPFFTSRYGYKLCLRCYLNGHSSGKGTHLSLFLVVMKGNYDALLSWPFRQRVTLMLLDQNKERDITRAFFPEPSFSSFQKPEREMNPGSGLPQFAPQAVLSIPGYVKNDILFFKVIIDKTGLDEP